MTKHIVVGAGEVGTAIFEILNEISGASVLIRDADPIEFLWGQVDFMHIAFPDAGDGKFVERVNNYADEYKPHTIVVHSTLTPGTMRKLGNRAVHVPTHGKHPHLAEHIKRITMFIGGMDPDRIMEVADMFSTVCRNVRPLIDCPPETTEITKVMCTTYYGWNILFEKFVHKLCEYYDVPFDVVYTEWNKEYNKGVMTPEKFNRPVMDHYDEACGGHCVEPNAVLMHQLVPDDMKWLFEAIMSMGQTIDGDKPYLDKTWLYCEYWGKGKSSNEIADEIGMTEANIIRIMRKEGIPCRKKNG